MPDSTNELIQAISKSFIVITNPTHHAVAIGEESKDNKLFVSAKGEDEQAFKIKKIASEYKILTVEQRELAHSLYSSFEIGASIPSNFAEIIYEIQGRHLLNFN